MLGLWPVNKQNSFRSGFQSPACYPDVEMVIYTQQRLRWLGMTSRLLLVPPPSLILNRGARRGSCLSVLCAGVCVCECWHLHREPGQGLSIINMSWWIPLRCGDMHVYSAVWRAKRRRRKGQTRVCNVSLHVDTRAEIVLMKLYLV